MNYKEALEYIHSTYKFGSKLGLENISKLMNILKNPQNDLNIIHVAGTNGKGSTSSMIRSVLTSCGYKTGFFISPYLERFTERIQIDDKEISKIDLAKMTFIVKKAVDKMLEDGYNHPTEFEIVTAIGLLYFKEKKVDFLVLEVGLGGRFDATNVIENSLISVITSISLDHTEYLGNTLEKIAFEKAGIIKENNKVVLYPQEEKIMDVIKNQGLKKNSQVLVAEPKYLIKNKEGFYSYKSPILNLEKFKTKFLGNHQNMNLAVALKTIEVLIDLGYPLKSDDIKKGLEKAFMPGRFEIVYKNPDIIIDCAHNIDGLQAFTRTIKEYKNNKELILFIGMLQDKKPEILPKELLEISKKIYTLTPNNPKGISGENLKEIIKSNFDFKDISSLSSYNEAVQIAKSQSKDSLSAFVGSFYMAGEIRTLIEKGMSKDS